MSARAWILWGAAGALALSAGCTTVLDFREYTFDGFGGAGGAASSAATGGNGGQGGMSTSGVGGGTCGEITGDGYLGELPDCDTTTLEADDFTDASATSARWNIDFNDGSEVSVCDGSLTMRPADQNAYWWIDAIDGSHKGPSLFQRVCGSFGIAFKGRTTNGSGSHPNAPYSGMALIVLHDDVHVDTGDLANDLRTWMLFTMGQTGPLAESGAKLWAYEANGAQFDQEYLSLPPDDAHEGGLAMCRVEQGDAWFFYRRDSDGNIHEFPDISLPAIGSTFVEDCCFDVGVTAHRFHGMGENPAPAIEAQFEWVHVSQNITTKEDCRTLLLD